MLLSFFSSPIWCDIPCIDLSIDDHLDDHYCHIITMIYLTNDTLRTLSPLLLVLCILSTGCCCFIYSYMHWNWFCVEWARDKCVLAVCCSCHLQRVIFWSCTWSFSVLQWFSLRMEIWLRKGCGTFGLFFVCLLYFISFGCLLNFQRFCIADLPIFLLFPSNPFTGCLWHLLDWGNSHVNGAVIFI